MSEEAHDAPAFADLPEGSLGATDVGGAARPLIRRSSTPNHHARSGARRTHQEDGIHGTTRRRPRGPRGHRPRHRHRHPDRHGRRGHRPQSGRDRQHPGDVHPWRGVRRRARRARDRRRHPRPPPRSPRRGGSPHREPARPHRRLAPGPVLLAAADEPPGAGFQINLFWVIVSALNFVVFLSSPTPLFGTTFEQDAQRTPRADRPGAEGRRAGTARPGERGEGAHRDPGRGAPRIRGRSSTEPRRSPRRAATRTSPRPRPSSSACASRRPPRSRPRRSGPSPSCAPRSPTWPLPRPAR